MPDLTPEERAELFAPDRRLTAYYFSLDATGSPTIDAILSAVAIAGKGCHHTNGWTERDEWARWGEGRSLVDVIQAAADNAAAERDALAEWRDYSEAEIDSLKAMLAGRCLSDITHRDEEHRQSVCMLPEGHAPLMHDDCMGCTWTDADHWEPSAIDALAAKVERVRAEVRVLDLDGESRWRDWRDRADMYGQGASMAYKDAAHRILLALDADS